MTVTAYPAPSADVNQQTTPVHSPTKLAGLVRDFLERLIQEKADREAAAQNKVQVQINPAQKAVQQ